MKKIGILLCDTDNPFWREKIDQYGKAAAAFDFEVEFRTARDSSDPEEQCRELLRMAREPYDAVVVNPLTGDNLFPALRGLPFPVFDVGPKCDPERTSAIENYFPVTAADFEKQGFLAGEALGEEALNGEARVGDASMPGPEKAGKGWALIVGGFHDARQSSLRCRGAFKALRRVFAQKRIVTVYANFNRDDAFQAVKELAPNLNLQAIFCANDLMALGASAAWRESFPDSPVPVGGVDAIPEALEALKNGTLFCTVSLPHGEVVRGVYRAVSHWFEGVSPSCGDAVADSVLIRRP